MRTPIIIFMGSFVFAAAQQQYAYPSPQGPYIPQVQSVRPVASSGSSVPSSAQSGYSSQSGYVPQQPSVQQPHTAYPVQPEAAPQPSIQQPYPTPVEEVDSVDVYPVQPEQPEEPEFRVVQPPTFTAAPLQPAPPPAPAPAPGPAPATAAPATKLVYEINYCDRKEFPEEVLAQYGLERVEYFIWNNTCSHIFFQCAIGETFMLKCPSEDEAFDRSTVNCNFKNSVKVCPEYDHVMHCSIREQCTQDEFACCSLPQKCLPLTKRCDGHNDCSDGDDENNCPSCQRDEFACVKSGRCIPAAQRCDNNPDDCQDGSNMDEIGCSKNTTCVGKFMCHQSFEGPSCIDYTFHCDGHRDCDRGEDEVNCKVSEAKYLLCENQKQQVLRSQWCDGTHDCADGSDEKYCY